MKTSTESNLWRLCEWRPYAFPNGTMLGPVSSPLSRSRTWRRLPASPRWSWASRSRPTICKTTEQLSTRKSTRSPPDSGVALVLILFRRFWKLSMVAHVCTLFALYHKSDQPHNACQNKHCCQCGQRRRFGPLVMGSNIEFFWNLVLVFAGQQLSQCDTTAKGILCNCPAFVQERKTMCWKQQVSGQSWNSEWVDNLKEFTGNIALTKLWHSSVLLAKPGNISVRKLVHASGCREKMVSSWWTVHSRNGWKRVAGNMHVLSLQSRSRSSRPNSRCLILSSGFPKKLQNLSSDPQSSTFSVRETMAKWPTNTHEAKAQIQKENHILGRGQTKHCQFGKYSNVFSPPVRKRWVNVTKHRNSDSDKR